ncbi:C2H2-type zinc finger family protein [Actinidia rufa]|uniref:C2H2-type zinc finger family protein n=1 Tax=Actinidia rufa TaxID=165716 RepID=A0A7J0FKT5_9ERIC|nr:C2H2-type zinc finger family protein [Actinidia rufa]
MTMKRMREEGAVEALAMANCLMLLSKVGKSTTSRDRVFACKTCNREFPTFQALGGHRASHKKPRLATVGESDGSLAKLKTHECSICGLEFATGQALGGHMRRHKAATASRGFEISKSSGVEVAAEVAADPVLKRSNSSKRVLCLDLKIAPWWIA